jgi:C4-type Zn-finger protein
MKLSRLTIALYMGIVFASGGVLGWFGQRLYTESTVAPKQVSKDPREFTKRLLTEYQRRLQLTPDQVTKLTVILDDTRAQSNINFQAHLKEAREKSEPEFQRIRQAQIERIQDMLNAPQKIEYEQMRKERELQRQQKKDGGKRGPGV